MLLAIEHRLLLNWVISALDMMTKGLRLLCGQMVVSKVVRTDIESDDYYNQAVIELPIKAPLPLPHTHLIPICPLFRTVDLITMCLRGSNILQGTVDLIPMCPLFGGFTIPLLQNHQITHILDGWHIQRSRRRDYLQ